MAPNSCPLFWPGEKESHHYLISQWGGKFALRKKLICSLREKLWRLFTPFVEAGEEGNCSQNSPLGKTSCMPFLPQRHQLLRAWRTNRPRWILMGAIKHLEVEFNALNNEVASKPLSPKFLWGTLFSGPKQNLHSVQVLGFSHADVARNTWGTTVRTVLHLCGCFVESISRISGAIGSS